MSSHPGYLKTNKNISSNIGGFLEKIGNTGSNIFGTGVVETGIENVGRVVGSMAIPIPFVGGYIGKRAGENIADALQYKYGLIGEIGKSIQDLNNGSSLGTEIKDVLTYIPKQLSKDWWDRELVQVATGRMTVPDAIMKGLQDYSGVGLFSDKTYAWKNDKGEYSKTWSREFNKPVVGKWIEDPTSLPRPEINSNKGILGVHNGEIFYKGFDDARWAALKK